MSIRSRLQWSSFSFEEAETYGFAVVQDFNFEFGKFKIGTRFALFEADDFENRQFAYERDVLYAFSIPSYSGVGIRNYVLVQYGLSKKLDIWLRMGRTIRNDVESIGSGRDKIEGNHRTDIKAQVRYVFR